MAGRVINGFGIGALVTAIPMYQAEVSTPESRGFMVSMHVSYRFREDRLKANIYLPGRYVCCRILTVCVARFRSLIHLHQWLQVLISMAFPHCLPNGPGTASPRRLTMAAI